jgi:pimeloyl-ACP methyl ester carboxylesterase
MHPDQVVAVCGMSVPYLGHSPRHEPMLERLQRDFGKCLPQNGASRKEQEEARFHYMLHHNLPRADEEYDRNRYEALYRLYAFTKGVEADEPEVTDRHMFPHSHQCSDDDNAPLDARSAPGFWARLPRPKSLPSWLSESDFQYYLNEYERSGFSGGLRWYQAMDRNWHLTKSLQGKQIHQPALFLCGKEDHLVLKNHGGEDHVIRTMNEHCTNLKTHMIPNAGHWIQQEVSELVTDQLLCFLSSLHVHRGESQTQSKL